MFEVKDLRTGDIIRRGENFEEVVRDLPEGFYEILKDGVFYQFYSVIKESDRSWI